MRTTLFLILAFASCQLWASERLMLCEGQFHSIPATSTTTVRITNGRTLAATTMDRGVRISAKRPGTSVVFVDNRSWKVQVLAAALCHPYRLLVEHLAQGRGLKAAVEKDSLIVSGRLLRWSDWLGLDRLSRNNGFEYEMRAEIPLQFRGKLQDYLSGSLRRANLTPVNLIFEPQMQATVAKQDHVLNAAAYSQILGPLGIALKISEDQIRLAPLVQLEVIMAEVNRTFHRQWGLSWSGAYQASVLPQYSDVSDLMMTLKALEKRGRGRILARPKLVCRSGSTAEFLAGGEFPIRVMGFRQTDVVWKKHGVFLQFKPRADVSGRMSIEVMSEVSLLDMANAVDGIPALKTNRLSSHFDLIEPRTVILSGLLRESLGASNSGWPWLTNLPVLGQLFSSSDFIHEKTELVVFVSPQVVSGEGPSDSIQWPQESPNDAEKRNR